MTPDRFEILFQLYKTNQLSQEGWEELRAAIREGGYDGYLQEELFRLLEKGGIHESWSPALGESMWEEILKGRSPMEQMPVWGWRVESGERRGMQNDAGGEDAGSERKPVREERAAGEASVGESSVEEVSVEEGSVEEETGGPRTGKEYLRRRHRAVRYTVAASLFLVIALSWWFRRPGPQRVVATARVEQSNVLPGSNKAILTLANGQQIVLDNTEDGQIAKQGSFTIIKLNGMLRYKGEGRQRGEGLMSFNTITTPRGGQFELILPDGSKAWLNSASSLRFPVAFTGKEREVELKGEGYFEIARNAAKPFTVSVNDMKIRVLGTSFNTMAYPEEGMVNTTLLQGAVEISEGGRSRRLVPGQQALLYPNGQGLSVGAGDVQKAVAWKNGLFEFDHTDLETIMRQLSRWYDIDVVYRAKTDRTALGGSISRSLGLKEVLNLLEANGINHFTIEGKKVFVLP